MLCDEFEENPTSEDLLAFLKKSKINKNDINAACEYLMPHLGDSPKNNENIGFYLAYMANKLLLAYEGIRPYDNPNHLQNTQIDGPG